MVPPLKRLIGTILLVTWVIVYAIVAVTIGDMKLPGQDRWVQVVYFLVAGLAWVPVAGWLITWMHREKPKANAGETVP